MPSAPPNCRAVVFSPLEVANLVGGADIAAKPDVPVVAEPMPRPINVPPGSQTARNAGCVGRPKTNQMAQAANEARPSRVANRGPPKRGASRPMPSAAMDATTAPGVSASPAVSSEYRQMFVRYSTQANVHGYCAIPYSSETTLTVVKVRLLHN